MSGQAPTLPSGQAVDYENMKEVSGSLYNFILDIKSVGDCASGGWDLEIAPELYEKVKQLIPTWSLEEDGALDANQTIEVSNKILQIEGKVVVAVVGLFNRGKTFLLNRLSNMQYACGKSYTTRGLSFAVPTNEQAKDLVILDTQGINPPLDKEAIERAKQNAEPFAPQTLDPDADRISPKERANRKIARELEEGEWFEGIRSKAIVDKNATETFLQQLIFSLANVLVIVVNEMTWQDQLYIEALTRSNTNSEKKKTIVVIHNYKDTVRREHFFALRSKYLLECYHGKLESKVLVDGSEIEVFTTTKDKIRHLFLVNDNCDLGADINSKTIQFLRQICFAEISPSDESIMEQVLDKSSKTLANLVRQVGELRLHYSNDKFSLRTDVKNLQFLRSDVGVEMGNLVVRPSNFQPTVDKLINKEGMYVNVDVPAIPVDKEDRKKAACECSLSINKRARQIVIKGNRSLYQLVDNQYISYQTFPTEKVDILRKGGEFSVSIPIPEEIETQYDKSRLPVFKDGQLHIFLPRIVEDPEKDQGI